MATQRRGRLRRHRVRDPALRSQPARSGPEGPDEVWHEPGARRLLEGQCHSAGLGLDELADGGNPVAKLVQQRVNVALETAPA